MRRCDFVNPKDAKMAVEDWVERRHRTLMRPIRPKAACPMRVLREDRLSQGEVERK